jgi:hypothetical protein
VSAPSPCARELGRLHGARGWVIYWIENCCDSEDLRLQDSVISLEDGVEPFIEVAVCEDDFCAWISFKQLV